MCDVGASAVCDERPGMRALWRRIALGLVFSRFRCRRVFLDRFSFQLCPTRIVMLRETLTMSLPP
jgi:hypothetical protein